LYYADWSSALFRATGTRSEAVGEEAAIIDCRATVQESADTVDTVEDMTLALIGMSDIVRGGEF